MTQGMGDRRCGPEALLELNQELAGIVKAGIPLDQGLLMAAREMGSPGMRGALQKVEGRVRQGASLSEAMAEQRGVFPESYVNMLAVGERMGSLTEVLDQLIVHYRRQSRLRAMVSAATVYPVFVLALSAGIIGLVLVFLMPRFCAIYAELGAELPYLTMTLIHGSNLVRYGHPTLVIFLVAFVLGYPTYKLIVQDVTQKDWGFMRFVPVFSRLYRYQNCLTFLSVMGVLLKRGVPLVEALGLARTAIVSASARAAIDRAREGLERGELPAELLGGLGFLPPIAQTMLRMGIQREDLGRVLDEVAEYYDLRVELTQGVLARVTEPFLVVALGLILGTIVTSLYLPLFDLPRHIGN